MITSETLGIDAARATSWLNWSFEVNNRVDWNVLGPACFVALVLLCLAYWNRDELGRLWAKSPLARWRERRRMRAEREARLREIVSDYITDALEQAYNDSDLTLEEKSLVYRRIGKLGYPDLLQRGELTLKEEIQKRRAAEKRDSSGNVIPISFPDMEGPTQVRKLEVLHVHIL